MLDRNRPYTVFEPISDNETNDSSIATFSVDSACKQYPTLSHYCSQQTFESILRSSALRCTRLNNVQLNDQFEYKRKNVEVFASSIFIFCLTHCKYEIVPFWMNYAGTDPSQKILLRFRNFSDDFLGIINTDYCLLSNGKKLCYKSDIKSKIAMTNETIDRSFSSQSTNFDTRSFLDKVQLFDINYLPITSEVFTTDYSNNAIFHLGNNGLKLDMPMYNPSVLGKYKTEHWSYEQETRIKLQLHPYDQDYFEFVDIRVNENLFKNMEVIMSPWAKPDMERQIEDIINESNLNEDIKSSISIAPSELSGQIQII